MFALKAGQGKRKAAGRVSARSARVSAVGIVLPRLLRKPARLLVRFAQGEFAPPRYLLSGMSAVLLASAGAYGAVLGGYMPQAVQAITARSGFAIDDLKVAGNQETSEIDILGSIGLDGWTSLIGFDAAAARTRIGELPWVKTVSVRKIYPDTLDVRIEEREPFAIWQHGSELTLIEASGNVIAPFSSSRHASLPLVVGLGAPERAAAFVAKVEQYPELAARVKGYIHIGERRWDLRLENGVTVKLPEDDADQAIADILEMDREQGLLSRDIAAVDMRLSDRLVIKLTPEAALRREASLTERAKAAKREKKI